tara:strand:- start:2478 stop:3305 length:828 start_codon:yes stop_codon:yes gene_type:complete
MTNITASQVNELRKQTGLGMMDCKSALVESNGDFEKAIEILRKKGQKVAAKRADREANEGVVLSATNEENNFGAIIVLNCETDFVAKNTDFISFAEQILSLALLNKTKTLEEVLILQIGGKSIKENIIEQTGVIGEKISLSSFEIVDAEFVTSYVHPGNKLSSIVGFNLNIEQDVAKNICMQIAAMNPIAIDEQTVSKDVLDREYNIGLEQAKEEGKPEQILDKIAEGRLKKFLKENTLLNQPFIKDNGVTVKKYLGQQKENTQVVDFKRIGLGY